MAIELRPAQWMKNLFVWAALLFTVPHVSVRMVGLEIVCFMLFCLVSGCVYVLNDILDLPVDRLNPDKAGRPIASGRIRPDFAAFVGGFLLVLSFATGWKVSPWLFAVLGAYFLVNVLYSWRLKHVALLDIFAIASGFVLRAVGGGVAIGVPLTSWFLICAMMLSLFLAIGKRRYELVLWQKYGIMARRVIPQYSLEFLNQMSGVTATMVILTYSMFTLSSGHGHALTVTVPLVAYGVFRYMQLTLAGDKGGKPEWVLLHDRQLQVVGVVFAAVVIALECTAIHLRPY
ncbi:decaprenyl-phosphate phosphoribosyltransferase [Alicyclobacillus herbarius]|uniref:decaprenyl-phosphate phosphoribosyltransferase n=1 Tax=Alicyclobacillus herbarius TaxID=122960 RepID=UPI00041E1EBB|nr:decaprenyl-phosphate phosphoribosyltransferase [Alicyclobacillus herbarius]